MDSRPRSGDTESMAQIVLDDDHLTVELSNKEKAGALRLHDVVVDRSSITAVTRLDDAREAIHGIRAPGTAWPGTIALGTYRTRTTRDFVAVYAKRPGYRIDLDGEHFDHLVVSSPPIAELDAID